MKRARIRGKKQDKYMQRIRFQWTSYVFFLNRRAISNRSARISVPLLNFIFKVFHCLKPSFVGSFTNKWCRGRESGKKTGKYMQRIRFQWTSYVFFLNRLAISNRSARIFVPVPTFLQGFSLLLCSVHYSSVQLLPRDKGRQTSLVNRGRDFQKYF